MTPKDVQNAAETCSFFGEDFTKKPYFNRGKKYRDKNDLIQ